MVSTSALTPEAAREWASSWADVYDQEIDEEGVSFFVGNVVNTRAVVDEEPKGFDGKLVIGYSFDRLTFPLTDEETEPLEWTGKFQRCSLVLADGVSCPIFASMTIEVLDD